MAMSSTATCSSNVASTGIANILDVLAGDCVPEAVAAACAIALVLTTRGWWCLVGGREDPLVDEEAERMAKRMRSLVCKFYPVWSTTLLDKRHSCGSRTASACATISFIALESLIQSDFFRVQEGAHAENAQKERCVPVYVRCRMRNLLRS